MAVDELTDVLSPVSRDLTAVSKRLMSCLKEPVAKKVVYLVAAGGKRLRPALVLLCGAAGPLPNRQALIDTAAAVELIHTATLIHDDIIDEALVRRSQPSFHSRWGTERAVLMGDYLYASAFTLLAGLQTPYVMRVMSDVCRQLCRGELLEVEARFRVDLTEREYFEIIADKTASLIGGCCRAGAHLGGCSKESIARFEQFGVNFGIAFQIIDDCLDLVGDQTRLGKTILTDLDKGALSLPIIYLAKQLSPRARKALFAPLRTRATDPVYLRRLATEARNAGAIAKAQARAAALIDEARGAVSALQLNGLQSAYEQLARYAVLRER